MGRGVGGCKRLFKKLIIRNITIQGTEKSMNRQLINSRIYKAKKGDSAFT